MRTAGHRHTRTVLNTVHKEMTPCLLAAISGSGSGPNWSDGRADCGLTAARLSYLFQWVFELRYKDGNMMGRIFAALSLIRLMMYSLFQ